MSERKRRRRPLSPRVLRWEDRTAWPMFALSLVFFAAWVWSLADTKLTVHQQNLLVGLIGVLWIVFIADIVVRLAICGSPREFLRTRWFEAVALVIVYLRPFVILVSIFTLLFVFTASTLVWLAERQDAHANIVNLGDAIWWGFSTLATVGYGDFVPVTPLGRTIAVGLMMGGLIVLGVTSATVISALTDQMHRVGQRLQHERALDAARGSTPGDADDSMPS